MSTPDELRRECLRLAVQFGRPNSTDQIIEQARRLEAFVLEAFVLGGSADDARGIMPADWGGAADHVVEPQPAPSNDIDPEAPEPAPIAETVDRPLERHEREHRRRIGQEEVERLVKTRLATHCADQLLAHVPGMTVERLAAFSSRLLDLVEHETTAATAELRARAIAGAPAPQPQSDRG